MSKTWNAERKRSTAGRGLAAGVEEVDVSAFVESPLAASICWNLDRRRSTADNSGGCVLSLASSVLSCPLSFTVENSTDDNQHLEPPWKGVFVATKAAAPRLHQRHRASNSNGDCVELRRCIFRRRSEWFTCIMWLFKITLKNGVKTLGTCLNLAMLPVVPSSRRG